MIILFAIDVFTSFTFLLTGNQIMIAFWNSPPTLTQASHQILKSPQKERGLMLI